MSLKEASGKNPEEKRLRASIKEEEWVDVPARKNRARKTFSWSLNFPRSAKSALDSAFKEVISASGSVRHLISRIEVEIADIDPSTETEDIEESVRGFFDHGSELELKVSLKDPSEAIERRMFLWGRRRP